MTGMTITSHYLLGLSSSGFHRIHYTQHGSPDNKKIVVCVHGLTRNARDFDFLAGELTSDYRVISPDVVGRGQSDWLTNKKDYGYPQYVADMTTLIARANTAAVDWIGTSMGGLIGMLLAAQPNTPIARLVINDVGPYIPKAALERIAAYVGKTPAFDKFEEMETYVRTISAPFGPLTDAQWNHLTIHNTRRLDDGTYTSAYDPGIAEAFKGQLEDVDLWPVWEAVKCPVLILRGAESDVLSAEDAARMAASDSGRVEMVEFAGVGHAPALMAADQITVVRDWLAS